MKRERQRRVRGEIDDRSLARAALGELREAWQAIPQGPPRRSAEAKLKRLAAETRELLALWTYYRLACLDAMDGGRMGLA